MSDLGQTQYVGCPGFIFVVAGCVRYGLDHTRCDSLSHEDAADAVDMMTRGCDGCGKPPEKDVDLQYGVAIEIP